MADPDSIILKIDQAHHLVTAALESNRTSSENAASVAQALVSAEIDGQIGHGLSRVLAYASQSRSGKVDGFATPRIIADKPAAVRIDAASGFAFPAMDLAVSTLSERVANTGIAVSSVFRSHHFGVAGYHAERLANEGIIALALSNSPRAIAPWGGKSALFGTNPVAFAAPRKDGSPLVIDLSLSKVARGKIMVAARNGDSIPEGWALDANGHPTTNADAALAGTMLPMGDAKGAALVLMVELLAAAMTGANFGFEASSFFTAEGDPPGIGQVLIGFDARMLSGDSYLERIEHLIEAIVAQPGTRLPGSRRLNARLRVEADGLAVSRSLVDELTQLANHSV
ncbi:MAG: sulfolactate dehydrogenase [marine bacterium B5-7]|nr:MAG: sulfolactate dehydrogenase [marine bacterium B5-7]